MAFGKTSLSELRADIQKAKEIEALRSQQARDSDAVREAIKKINRIEDCVFYYARNITDIQKRNGELTEEVAMLELKNNGLVADLAVSTAERKAQQQLIDELNRKIEALEKKNRSQKEKMQQDKESAKEAASVHLHSSAGLTPRPSIARVSRTPSVSRTLFTPMSTSSPIDETHYMSAVEDNSTVFPGLGETPLCRPKTRRRSLSAARGILKAVRRSFSGEPRAQLDTTLEVEKGAKKKTKVLFDL